MMHTPVWENASLPVLSVVTDHQSARETAQQVKSVLKHIAREEKEEGIDKQSLGVRMAERVTDFLGRWSFIWGISALSSAWMVANTMVTRLGTIISPDPFPYPLLNLNFALVGALTAPVILMSQNRQDEKRKHRDAEFQELSLLRATLFLNRAEAESFDSHPSIQALSQHLFNKAALSSDQNAGGFWRKMAGQISEVLGTWKTVGVMTAVTGAWIGFNELLRRTTGFAIDPYPYIFLNLGLSMLAALTGPIVLMSHKDQQAREESRNRWFQKLSSLTARAELEQLHHER